MSLNTAASISLSQINSSMYFTNGNVGINTTVPASTVDIAGTFRVSTSASIPNIIGTAISSGSINATTIVGSTSVSSGMLSATNATVTNVSSGSINATNATVTNVSSGSINATNVIATNVSSGSIIATTIVGSIQGTNSTITNAVHTTLSSGTAIFTTGITTGTLLATTSISSGSIQGTNSTITNAVHTTLTSGTAIFTTGITTSSLFATSLNLSSVQIALGSSAGAIGQSTGAIAIGNLAGNTTQGSYATALGFYAGGINQGQYAIGVGIYAGSTNQGSNSIAMGNSAGKENQGTTAVALGAQAGQYSQGNSAIAIGVNAARNYQSSSAVAIGDNAAYNSQGTYAVAIGSQAGYTSQGSYAIAIGYAAGQTSQHANSIILNASSTALNSGTAGALYVNPVRNATQANLLGYNTTTKEVSYFSLSNITTTNLVATNISSASLYSTIGSFGTISSSLLSATTMTGGSISLSGNLNVGGTLTVVNITSTNLMETNITAGIARITTNLAATGNSNTIGSIFTTGGNVGINTTSPGSSLHVAGSIPVSPVGSGVHLGLDPSTYAVIQLNSTVGSYIDFSTPGSDTQARIMAKSGNIGIGTDIPSYKLDVSGTSRIGGAHSYIYNNYNNGSYPTGNCVQIEGNSDVGGSTFNINSGHDSTNTRYLMTATRIGSNPDTPFCIRMDGNVGIGTTSPAYKLQLSSDSAAKPSTNTWTISSDSRLKTNIQMADLDICYNIIKTIPLKRYTWRDDIYTTEQVPDRSKLGWIAQDVEILLPKAVEQKEMHGYSDCRTLNSDQLIASLYGAVQKLMITVEELQNRINQN